jgi:hypothetical protein
MEKGTEVGERCDFRYIPLHAKSGTGQVVALAHFYVGCQGFLSNLDLL